MNSAFHFSKVRSQTRHLASGLRKLHKYALSVDINFHLKSSAVMIFCRDHSPLGCSDCVAGILRNRDSIMHTSTPCLQSFNIDIELFPNVAARVPLSRQSERG